MLREEALARLVELGVSRADVVLASQGTNIDDEHDPEGATIAFERAQLDALAARAHGRLVEIDAALARLADGLYGRCEVCGEDIGAERLEARPATARCVRHA